MILVINVPVLTLGLKTLVHYYCFIKEIKNALSALLRYISRREFLRTRERSVEKHEASCFSQNLVPWGREEEIPIAAVTQLRLRLFTVPSVLLVFV